MAEPNSSSESSSNFPLLFRNLSLGVFPPPMVVPPRSATHNTTIVFLHGRGWNAQNFHALLFSTPTLTNKTLPEALPNTKFIFPTAPLMRARKYRRSVIHQWYEGSGDWEPESRGEMRPSIEHIHGILREEVAALGGDARRVALAGFSQGGAMSLMSNLLWAGQSLGAVVVMSGFMPVNALLLEILEEDPTYEQDDIFTFDSTADDRTPLQRVVDALREEAELDPASASTFPFISTPVLMAHGALDRKVKLKHGQQAAKLLEKMGIPVEFHMYAGLDHAYSPEVIEQVVAFLSRSGIF